MPACVRARRERVRGFVENPPDIDALFPRLCRQLVMRAVQASDVLPGLPDDGNTQGDAERCLIPCPQPRFANCSKESRVMSIRFPTLRAGISSASINSPSSRTEIDSDHAASRLVRIEGPSIRLAKIERLSVVRSRVRRAAGDFPRAYLQLPSFQVHVDLAKTTTSSGRIPWFRIRRPTSYKSLC